MDARKLGLLDAYCEVTSVSQYKTSSETYKNFQKAAAVNSQGNAYEKISQSLYKASSFAEMLSIVSEHDIEKEPFPLQFIAKSVVTVGSFFSTMANAAYYYMQLKRDIINFAIEKGYCPTQYLPSQDQTFSQFK